ncbi:hypothetical protein [Luteolibacter marinus]|uniref:hypothetical protein n=1 Tax=Luteolibacter marinus TaxID=2776705 RepID=UPI0018665C4F|nr:hypothetical protein [Luteolibacter marinus]
MPDTIEAEVLEIDGSPPPDPRREQPESRAGNSAWQSMQGRVLRLDRRWWPLWVLLGIVAFALLMTVGVLVAILVVVAKVVGGILRLFTGGGGAGTSISTRSV